MEIILLISWAILALYGFIKAAIFVEKVNETCEAVKHINVKD